LKRLKFTQLITQDLSLITKSGEADLLLYKI